jgi:threonine aldolase
MSTVQVLSREGLPGQSYVKGGLAAGPFEEKVTFMDTIDLRSDTVTKPTESMRRAMVEAEVGDDVYGEDPTVNRLEERAAEIFEKEAALFVPTGTMGNQIAVRLHTQHGQEVICERRAHVVDWEMAMVSAFSGCQLRQVEGERGVLPWERIAAAIATPIYYRARTGLIMLENTHNMAGGTITPPAVLEEVWSGAAERGLPVHLDGARVFNAAVALGQPVAALARGCATVMFCLSKMLGGGMRKAGVLAAAGLVALEEMPARLREDHANARWMAEQIAVIPGCVLDLETVRTNIVIFRSTDRTAAETIGGLKLQGVLCGTAGPDEVRFVTHRDVDRAACERAVSALRAVLRQAGNAA